MSLSAFAPNQYFHLYFTANSTETLFGDDEAYRYFLKQYSTHIGCVADTFAYCLLPTHFHIFLRTYSINEQYETWDIPTDGAWDQFEPTDFANAFRNVMHECFPETVQLDNIHCIRVNDEANYLHLIRYIHQNPALHKVHTPFQTWRWSSYKALLQDASKTQIAVVPVLEWFNGVEWFEETHWEPVDEIKIGYLILDD